MSQNTRSMSDSRRKMMLEGSLLKVICITAIPMMISMLIDSIYNMTDTFFVSQLGITATAAVGINDSLLLYIRAISMGVGAGAASLLSRLLGQGNEKEANRVASTSLYSCIGLMCVLGITAYAFLEPIVVWIGATETVLPHSMSYARIILISVPFTAFEVVASQILRSEGSARLSMIGTVSGCVVNVILDPVFITWLGMGVGGAALATTISKGISCIILLYPFLRKKTVISINPRNFKPGLKLYRDVVVMGFPSFLRSALMTTSFVVINNVAGSFGDAALAATTISKKTTQLVSSAIMGFGMGYQPLAGFCWGAKKYKRLKDSFWTCTFMGWAACLVLGAVLFVFAKQLMLLFTVPSETEVIRLGVIMIRTQCAVLIPHVWGVIINGLCLGLGKPLSSMLVGLSRSFICLTPSVVILSRLFGANGLAWSQAVADLLSMVICVPIVIIFMKHVNKSEREVSNG